MKGRALTRILWMALFLERNRVITYNDARDAFGISMRTYRRYIRALRDAGLILDYGLRTPSHGWGKLCDVGTHFIAFDDRIAPIREGIA